MIDFGTGTEAKLNVLMVGVDEGRIGGMWSVAETYIKNETYNKFVNLKYVATSTGGSKFKRTIKMFSGYLKILVYLSEKKVDMVHIHMAEKGSVYRKGFVVKLAKLFKIKTIIQMHAGPIMSWYNTLREYQKKRVREILNSPDKLLVLGNYWKEQLCEIVPSDKIDVLYNGADCSCSNRYNINGNYITFMGMITKRKGAYDLIDSIKLIDKDLPKEITIILCGFDEENKAKEYARNLNLNHRIIFPGWIDKEKKNEVLQNTCICVLPSYFEGLSMTVVESISYGIPIITTNISTMPEIVGDSIHMVLPGDIIDLAETIKNLISDKSKRYEQSRYLYRRAKSIFSIEKNINETLRIYNECLKV